jgi:hypothetical protein
MGERPAGVKARWGGGRAFSRLIRTSRIMVSLYRDYLAYLVAPGTFFLPSYGTGIIEC